VIGIKPSTGSAHLVVDVQRKPSTAGNHRRVRGDSIRSPGIDAVVRSTATFTVIVACAHQVLENASPLSEISKFKSKGNAGAEHWAVSGAPGSAW
jgi:hypothetical protein